MTLYRNNFIKLFGLSYFEKELIKDKIDLIFLHTSIRNSLIKKTKFYLYLMGHVSHRSSRISEIKFNKEFIKRKYLSIVLLNISWNFSWSDFTKMKL